MSRFDQDTSTMRMRIEATPIELRKPEMGPQSKARGIMVGALLGAAAWAAIIALGVAVWRWLS
jgi:fatty acid desaturase